MERGRININYVVFAFMLLIFGWWVFAVGFPDQAHVSTPESRCRERIQSRLKPDDFIISNTGADEKGESYWMVQMNGLKLGFKCTDGPKGDTLAAVGYMAPGDTRFRPVNR